MTRRESSRSRRAPSREERDRILVVCGGKSTEPAYLRGLKRQLGNAAVTVDVRCKGVDPRSLVRYASGLQRDGGYDQAWCVVDVDEFDLVEAVAAARGAGVHLAISNPCFEFWLLLHFERCVAPMASYAHVLPRLKKHVPGYEKSTLRFDDYGAGVEDAVVRARDGGCVPGSEHLRNPSTGMWALVEKIAAN